MQTPRIGRTLCSENGTISDYNRNRYRQMSEVKKRVEKHPARPGSVIRRLALAPALTLAVAAGLGLAAVTGGAEGIDQDIAPVHVAAGVADSAGSEARRLELAHVAWTPEAPVRGTIFQVRVTPVDAAIERVEAHLAGQPLHFTESEGDEGFTALAAVPVSAGAEETLGIEVRTVDGARESRELVVPLSAGDYAMEALSVAPEYDGGWDAETAARIQAEVERARAVSRASHGTPQMWDAPFVRPLPGEITSGFGNGRIFNGEVQSRHTGVDFAGNIGDPVHAPARGVVRIVDVLYLGGNAVYIDHGSGLVTAYLHLSEAEVQEGDTVQTGQIIGRVGATGRVTGPHLHWIVRYGPISVDGMSLPGIGASTAGNMRSEPGR